MMEPMATSLPEHLLQQPAIASHPVARELVWVMTRPTGTSSSGFAYLQPGAWRRFRDWVPHILGDGPAALAAVELVVDTAARAGFDEVAAGNLGTAADVVRQVVRTAAICAPPDLWLLRHVVGQLARTGVAARLLAGETVDAASAGRPEELEIDLRFLLSRDLLVRVESGAAHAGYRLAMHGHARDVLALPPVDDGVPASLSAAWAELLRGRAAEAAVAAVSSSLARPLPADRREPGLWSPTAREAELAARLVPLVIGMTASSRMEDIVAAGRGAPLSATLLCPGHGAVGEAALTVLTGAGVVDGGAMLTDVGARVLERGPGPFGIIEAYRPYLDALPRIWQHGRGSVHVERSANVAASQAANAKTFSEANDALDRFCRDTGFGFRVFIEHALGRGEATRQRWARSRDRELRYFGADLEDAAIAAARVEHQAGRLPPGMIFVERADIGDPTRLLSAIREAGESTEGAVMIVGNGFHEVRGQTDARMIAVFEGYERAGIVLLFTEESALAIDDLLETAWNTYHAGFRYVHERSGQGLRSATPRPPLPLEGVRPASWTECAERAGYVRLERYCRRGRTVYPYPPPAGHNPAISVNHFFAPRRIAAALGLAGTE
jgi:hypothetical protein